MDHEQTTPVRANAASGNKAVFLVLPGSSLMNVAAAIDPLRAANRLSREKLFDWRVLSPDGGPPELSCGIRFEVDGPFEPSESGQLLVVIAGFNHQTHTSDRLVKGLRQAARNFELVVAIEAGTWLLARAGIVTTGQVTTHWEDLELLSQAHPDLDVRNDRYVAGERVWTCGGASPALDMMLHYIRSRHGPALALDVASVFVYDESHLPTDAQPLISLGRLSEVEPRVSASVRLMEKTIDNPLPVSAIARRTGLSTKRLETLFVRHLGETPGRYYLRLRLQAARKMVLDTALSMQEIAIRTGFSSQSALSRSFRLRYGTSPSSLRRRAA